MNGDSKNTIDELKTLIRQIEKHQNVAETFTKQKKLMSENLRSTIEMLGDEKAENLNKIKSLINNYKENSLIEVGIYENCITDLQGSFSNDKVKKMEFLEKSHTFRQSQLSVMFHNDENIKAIYYLLVALYLWLMVWVIIDDRQRTGGISMNILYYHFEEFIFIMCNWMVMFFYSLLITVYVKIIEHDSYKHNRIRYIPGCICYIIYQLILYAFAIYILVEYRPKMVCSFILSCEMARMSLKIHAYFREKVLYGLKDFHKDLAYFSLGKNELTEDKLPKIQIETIKIELKKIVFFLFCPSLIYRDSYPRLIFYRYDKIAAHIVNFLLCCSCLYLLFRYICSPYLTTIKLRNMYSLLYFAYDTIRLSVVGTFFLIIMFFLVLHTWMNLFSELLLFGDRRFYEDWWNCTNFEEWYRKWNMVVHEWLYYYVYNDVIRLSKGRNSKFVAKIVVFTLSVLIHEIIVWRALGFFFPILSFFFGGPGIIFTYLRLKNRSFNILFWWKLFIGIGMLLCLFLREFYLRDFIDNEIGLITYWHSYIPRHILIYFESYKTLIEKSIKY
jgi:sterol O-acyltransferase